MINIKIQKIKLSPKKGGNGFVSSYSVNIGSDEAKECGFIGDDVSPLIVKSIDVKQGKITIYAKKMIIDSESIQAIIQLAQKIKELNETMMSKIPRIGKIYNFSDVPDVSPDSENLDARAVYEATQELKTYLHTLPFESITDIATLMCIGREGDYDKSLVGEQRFLDYWAYLSDISLFKNGKEALIEYIVSKSPLPDNLQKGLRAIQ